MSAIGKEVVCVFDDIENITDQKKYKILGISSLTIKDIITSAYVIKDDCGNIRKINHEYFVDAHFLGDVDK